MGRELHTPEAVSSALGLVLERLPGARVLAVSEQGMFVEMPPSLQVGDHPTIVGRSPVDLVLGDDLAGLIEAWEWTKTRGSASVKLRLIDGTTGMLYIFDVTAEHGVYVGVLEELLGEEHTLPGAARTVERRVARMRKNSVASITEVDEAGTELLGWSAEELLGRRPSEFIHPDDFDTSVDAWMHLLQHPGGMFNVRVRHLCKDGRWLWVDIMNHNLLDTHGDVVSEIIDASDIVEAQLALSEREELLRRLTDALPSGVLNITPTCEIAYSNARVFDLFAVERTEHVDRLLSNLNEADRSEFNAGVERALQLGTDADFEITVGGSGALECVCSVSIRALHAATGEPNGLVVTVTDISDTARRRSELEVQASFDALTGCHNRASIFTVLEAAVSHRGSSDAGTAVLFIDLDGFKPINDQLGHSAGDELLRVVADRLGSAVRDHDHVGRFGGDEFLVVCPNIVRSEVAEEVANRLSQAVRAPTVIAGTTLRPSASFGLAWAMNGDTTAQSLVDRADAAMYEAKRANAGPNRDTAGGVAPRR